MDGLILIVRASTTEKFYNVILSRRFGPVWCAGAPNVLTLAGVGYGM